MWRDVPPIHNGFLQMSPGAGGGGPVFADLAEHYIGWNGYTRFWDDEAKAPFLFNGTNFISYDDEESIHAKCQYILRNGLAGMFYWEHGCDPSGTLLRAISAGLQGV
jgi:chitinase